MWRQQHLCIQWKSPYYLLTRLDPFLWRTNTQANTEIIGPNFTRWNPFGLEWWNIVIRKSSYVGSRDSRVEINATLAPERVIVAQDIKIGGQKVLSASQSFSASSPWIAKKVGQCYISKSKTLSTLCVVELPLSSVCVVLRRGVQQCKIHKPKYLVHAERESPGCSEIANSVSTAALY